MFTNGWALQLCPRNIEVGAVQLPGRWNRGVKLAVTRVKLMHTGGLADENTRL